MVKPPSMGVKERTPLRETFIARSKSNLFLLALNTLSILWVQHDLYLEK